MVLWKKLWYCGQNYGAMEKNYGTIPKTRELLFTMEKTTVLFIFYFLLGYTYLLIVFKMFYKNLWLHIER